MCSNYVMTGVEAGFKHQRGHCHWYQLFCRDHYFASSCSFILTFRGLKYWGKYLQWNSTKTNHELTNYQIDHDEEDVWFVSFLPPGCGGCVRYGDVGAAGPGRHRHRPLHHHHQLPPRDARARGRGGRYPHVCSHLWMLMSSEELDFEGTLEDWGQMKCSLHFTIKRATDVGQLFKNLWYGHLLARTTIFSRH